jgi:hypothetical protein
MKIGEAVRHSDFPILVGVLLAEYEDGTLDVLYEDPIGERNITNTGLLALSPVSTSDSAPLKSKAYVYRAGEKILRTEFDEEKIQYVLDEAKDWITIQELVVLVTNRFSQYTMEDGSPLNQGGFDPMFCVTQANPGYFIRNGLLIFRPAPPRSGCQWVFKNRKYATRSEIVAAAEIARAKNKFVLSSDLESEPAACLQS